MNPENTQELKKLFSIAAIAAREELRNNILFSKWLEKGWKTISPSASQREGIPANVQFSQSFRVEAYQSLGRKLLGGDLSAPSGFTVNEDSTYIFQIINDYAPTSVLFAAIGPEILNLFPGCLGNMVIDKQDVKKFRYDYCNLISELGESKLKTKAKEFLQTDVGDDQHDLIDKIFNILPTALNSAENDNSGIYSLSIGEI